jgi:hypothetical protein
MENIILKLGTGSIYKYPKTPAVSITIASFSDITDKIIPARASARRIPGETGDAFFNKYPIMGVKLYDYLD